MEKSKTQPLNRTLLFVFCAMIVSFLFFGVSSAFAYTLQTTTGTSYEYYWGCSGHQKIAQKFTTTDAGEISLVTARIAKEGSPSDNAFIAIYDDNSNTPGTQVGSNSGNVAESGLFTLPTSASVELAFSLPVTIDAISFYWAILSDTNYDSSCASPLNAYGDNSSGGMQAYDGMSWDDSWMSYAINIVVTVDTGAEPPAGVSIASTTANATTTLAYIGSSNIGMGILVTLVWLMAIGFIFNSMTDKRFNVSGGVVRRRI